VRVSAEAPHATPLTLDPPAQKAGRLSGGQLALTIAAAKRPEQLIFDGPVAALNTLARRAFLQNLMEFVAEIEVSVMISSHLLDDLGTGLRPPRRTAASRVQLPL
jgi:ABC-2 type transport system ATP-binding protein